MSIPDLMCPETTCATGFIPKIRRLKSALRLCVINYCVQSVHECRRATDVKPVGWSSGAPSVSFHATDFSQRLATDFPEHWIHSAKNWRARLLPCRENSPNGWAGARPSKPLLKLLLMQRNFSAVQEHCPPEKSFTSRQSPFAAISARQEPRPPISCFVPRPASHDPF